MKNYLSFLLIIFILPAKIFSQDKLFIEKVRKPSKKKEISLVKAYSIKTKKAFYKNGNIVDFTDSTLLLAVSTKTGKDTVYTYLDKVRKNGDSTYSVKIQIYQKDTVLILFNDIQSLQTTLFKSRRWLEPFGWIGVGAIMGVALLPVAAIDKGAIGVKEWAIFEGTLIAISAIPIFIGTRKVKYDLVKKWRLRAGKIKP